MVPLSKKLLASDLPKVVLKPRRLTLKRLKRHASRFLDFLVTEYHYRFNRQAIRTELESVRRFPRNLHIEGTNVCNAKCTFCAYPQMERPKDTMPMETFEQIINEYVQMGGRAVSLTPIVGDPFVDRHLFERLDYLAQRPEIRGFYFFTNAILMKPAISQQLLTYGEKLRIYVSCGGFDRDTYRTVMGVDQFDIVRRNIAAFVEQKRQTGASTRFTLALRCAPGDRHGEFWEECQGYIREGLMTTVSNATFDSWAGKIQPNDLWNAGLEPSLHPYKRGACELLFMKPVVLANGKVNACACRDVEAELIVGDLNNSSLKDIWAGQGIDDIIDRHERGDFPDVCKRCTWYTSIYNLRKRQIRINQDAMQWNEEDEDD